MTVPPDVIDQLGGPVRVARDLGCRPSVVFNWKARGVPRARQLDIWAYAARRGVDLCLPGFADLRLVPRSDTTSCTANDTTSSAAAAA